MVEDVEEFRPELHQPSLCYLELLKKAEVRHLDSRPVELARRAIAKSSICWARERGRVDEETRRCIEIGIICCARECVSNAIGISTVSGASKASVLRRDGERAAGLQAHDAVELPAAQHAIAHASSIEEAPSSPERQIQSEIANEAMANIEN